MNETQGTKLESQIFTALDIGTTKTCALAGRVNEYGKLEILGIGKVASTGVERGVVRNLEQSSQAIREALNLAEKQAGRQLGNIHVGIAGQHIKSFEQHTMITLPSPNSQVSKKDVEALIANAHRTNLPAGDQIIHVLPKEFILDGEYGIENPIGRTGSRLEANFHFITGNLGHVKNVEEAVKRAGYSVASITLEPLASSRAVLTDEEMQGGVVLVDIGGGTTDIAVFHNNSIIHTDVIPIGGNIITRDLKDAFRLLDQQAEALKIQCGTALSKKAGNSIITVPGIRDRAPIQVLEINLAKIIQARVEELFDLVYWSLQQSGMIDKLHCGITLTGGGALLNDIADHVSAHSSIETTLGLPDHFLATNTIAQVKSPMYSTAIGLLLSAADQASKQASRKDSKSPINEQVNTTRKAVKGVFKSFTSWLEGGNDTPMND